MPRQKMRQLYEKYRNFTMVPELAFIHNLELCSKFNHIPGSYAECGVWRGGMTAAISEILQPGRSIHLFDSFEGLPPAKDIDGQAALAWQQNTTSPAFYDNCTAEEQFAIEAMAMAGCKSYRVHKGWFETTTLNFDEPIAILRLDGDWYDSIHTCLVNLFPFVQEGGLVLLDDYHTWDGCARAVHDYLSANRLPTRILQWQNDLAYLVKKS